MNSSRETAGGALTPMEQFMMGGSMIDLITGKPLTPEEIKSVINDAKSGKEAAIDFLLKPQGRYIGDSLTEIEEQRELERKSNHGFRTVTSFEAISYREHVVNPRRGMIVIYAPVKKDGRIEPYMDMSVINAKGKELKYFPWKELSLRSEVPGHIVKHPANPYGRRIVLNFSAGKQR